ncbi:VOC family protein [Sediminibacillus dalangtanensis]|uniref:VOC family protein n=1 Tax=Sediminibacillus dalangtanensis TaxID=2729421 RepID=A0ABX7VS38_9BACI|nr:VOC family protein [Sediminibacillus dalangtanensis]QTM99754.1 VOC family protein [Sediminibacillus dalangtanensis]
MDKKLIRVGTTYLPVADVNRATEWYVTNLDADLSYQDEEKAILNLADQSFFLVKAGEKQTANFLDATGKERFSITFEVDGLEALQAIRQQLLERGVKVGAIEDRGHPGNNFTFYDLDGNKFDVWSELSPVYKKLHRLTPLESVTGEK